MKPLLPMLAATVGVRDQDLLEQDVRLHLLLGALTGDGELGGHLVFKGGTCLIKCYLDYPRLSTDLDFTWEMSSGPGARSAVGTKELRRLLRPVQRSVIERLGVHAAAGDFRLDPGPDVAYGRSNRMMTVALRYRGVSGLPGLVKVQVNFDERMLYPTRRSSARSLLRGVLPPALRLLDSDISSRYSQPVPVVVYDPREILAEKGRAILTRSAAKSRDMVDLYLLESQMGLTIEEYEDAILEKTRHVLPGAERYRRQLSEVDDRLDLLGSEDVTPLLLKPLNDRAFERFRGRIIPWLRGLATRLRSEPPGEALVLGRPNPPATG